MLTVTMCFYCMFNLPTVACLLDGFQLQTRSPNRIPTGSNHVWVMTCLFENLDFFLFLWGWRRRTDTEPGVAFPLGNFFVQALCLAVRQYPIIHTPTMNASGSEERRFSDQEEIEERE
jgi:hypothetical protein